MVLNNGPQKLIQTFGRHLEFSLQEVYENAVEWHQITLTLKNYSVVRNISPRYLWLKPVMVATQEAEIRRVGFDFSPGK
jgi:hypothetical protein